MLRLLCILALGCAVFGQSKPVDFQREIRPILSDACYACHGPDSSTRMANLRLDVPGPGIVPGKPDQSKVWKRISHATAALRMPPPQAHKTLTPEQIALVRRWIEQGAEYKTHWSFTAPRRSAVPVTKNPSWPRNAIDSFILARLEAEGLAPAAEADKRTLARRLSLDLTGLPPAPAEVEAFVKDASPDAYEKLVDRWIATPQFGEHRARYWLDAARYADTHGLHVDNYREMWSYRDWVINAFNRNLPFDRFTIEQLAGDLLPNPTLEQRIATGFHRCNITTNEGGSIEDEVAAIYAKDRVDTTGTVWMGLTIGCATCHDHKFDPLSQKEFYQMAAFFRNTTQKPMDGNIPDTPPIIVVPAPADRERWEVVAQEEKALRSQREAYRKTALETAASSLKEPFENYKPAYALKPPSKLPQGVTASGAELQFGKQANLPVKAKNTDLDSAKPFTISAWVNIPKTDGDYVIASKLDWIDKENNIRRGWMFDLESRRLRFQLYGGADDDLLLIRAATTARIKTNEWHHLAVTFDGSRDFRGLALYIDGRPVAFESNTNAGYGTIAGSTLSRAPLTIGGDGVKRYFEGASLRGFEIRNRQLNVDEVELLAGWQHPSGRAPETLRLAHLVRNDSQWRQLTARWFAAAAERDAIRRRAPITHVMNEIKDKEPEANILFRGMYDQPRDKVLAEVPAVLGSLPKDLPRNRMGLAQWLVSPSNPLTSRVTVNRFWQEVFGTGLVRSAEDFGAQGTAPSHPELLDWMAVEFRESGWDVKKFIRLLVTSAAYRQQAVATEEKRRLDPENLLLSRGPRFRMDAEMVRDSALASSGLLTKTIGGPSVRPYQPDGIWETVAMKGSNTRFYKQDHGDKLYRRSMYTFWKRSAPPASMDVLNAPTRENCTVRRERTNTPLQALLTMNDVQYVEAARFLAERAMRERAAAAFDDKANFIAVNVLSRPMVERELAVLRKSHRAFLSHYDSKPAEAKKLIATGEKKADPALPPAELAAWTMVASQVINLDEALNK